MTLVRTTLVLVDGIALCVAATLGAHTAQSGPRREPRFQNALVKVWKSTIMPKQPLSLHCHEHPRALIAITGGNVEIVEKSGESEWHLWESGKTYWHTADTPGTTHADVNNGAEPIELIVVELQQH